MNPARGRLLTQAVRPTSSPGGRSEAYATVRAAPGLNKDAAFPIFAWLRALLAAHQRGEIKSGAIAVGLALWTFADNETAESFPSVAAIARRVGATVDGDNNCRSVRLSMGALKRAGLIDSQRRGFMKPNRYRLRWTGETDRQQQYDGNADSGHTKGDRNADSGVTGISVPANSPTELTHPPPTTPEPHPCARGDDLSAA